MERALLIGIDGGATHSTAVAAWPDGTVAAVAYGEGLNYNNVGVETVRLRMEDIVRRLCENAGGEADCVCVGTAALDMPADAAVTAQFAGLLDACQLDLQSDAYAALMGLTQGEPGMIAICGTGSMLLLADSNGNQYASGGWGYTLRDAGSGYAIAREGLMAVVDEYEGVGPATEISRHACGYFGADGMRGIIEKLYAPDFTPDRLAGFARHVLEEAANGDDTARDIISDNMKKLAAQAAALFGKAPGAVRIGLYGGIFAHSDIARREFETALHARMPEAVICAPEYPPELGAVIHIMKKRGLLDARRLHNLKTTYERIRK